MLLYLVTLFWKILASLGVFYMSKTWPHFNFCFLYVFFKIAGSQPHNGFLLGLELPKETAHSLKLDEGKEDRIRPSAPIFAVKCSKHRIYTSYNPP